MHGKSETHLHDQTIKNTQRQKFLEAQEVVEGLSDINVDNLDKTKTGAGSQLDKNETLLPAIKGAQNNTMLSYKIPTPNAYEPLNTYQVD